MVTPHLPWKFHANRSSRFLVILLTKKQKNKQTNEQTKKSIENNTPSQMYRGQDKLFIIDINQRSCLKVFLLPFILLSPAIEVAFLITPQFIYYITWASRGFFLHNSIPGLYPWTPGFFFWLQYIFLLLKCFQKPCRYTYHIHQQSTPLHRHESGTLNKRNC